MNEKENPDIIDIEEYMEQAPSRRERLGRFLSGAKDTVVGFAPFVLGTSALAIASGALVGFSARIAAGDLVESLLGSEYTTLGDENGVPVLFYRSDLLDEGESLTIYGSPIQQQEEE